MVARFFPTIRFSEAYLLFGIVCPQRKMIFCPIFSFVSRRNNTRGSRKLLECQLRQVSGGYAYGGGWIGAEVGVVVAGGCIVAWLLVAIAS